MQFLVALDKWDCEAIMARCSIGIALTLALHPSCKGLEYLGPARSKPWLLMAWLLMSLRHQQPWYWLCIVGMFLSSLRVNLNSLWHFCAGKKGKKTEKTNKQNSWHVKSQNQSWHTILWWMKQLCGICGIAGIHFMKYLWAHNCDLVNFFFAVFSVLMIQSDHKFCTCHDSSAVVTCAQFVTWLDHRFSSKSNMWFFLRDLSDELIKILWNGSQESIGKHHAFWPYAMRCCFICHGRICLIFMVLPSIHIDRYAYIYISCWGLNKMADIFKCIFAPWPFRLKGYCRCLRFPSICPCVGKLFLVRMITHHRFELESLKFAPNMHHVTLAAGIKNRGNWAWPSRSFWRFWLRILGNLVCPCKNLSQN